LHLARHRLGVERGTLLGALAARAQEHILAPVDQDARLRFVAGSDKVDEGDREYERSYGRGDDPASPARQRLTEAAQIDVARPRWGKRLPRSRRRRGGRLFNPHLLIGLTPHRKTHRTLPRTPRPCRTLPDYTPLRLPPG